MTKNEILEALYKTGENSLQLKYSEACTIQKILVDRGYAVMITGADLGDDYKISWLYAGDLNDLDYANDNNVVFASRDWLDLLAFGDYEEDCEGEKDESD